MHARRRASTRVDGDDFTGTVKVKLGPIGLTYKGKASFIEKDEAAHRAVIDAQGRDARGNGTAAAKVTATLTEQARPRPRSTWSPTSTSPASRPSSAAA